MTSALPGDIRTRPCGPVVAERCRIDRPVHAWPGVADQKGFPNMSNDDRQASARIAFTVEQPVLLEALAFAYKGIPSRVPAPVLAGVVLASDGEAVTVEQFDYEQSRRIALRGATCLRSGSVLVSGALLLAMVKALPKGKPITVTGEGTDVRLTNGKTTYTVPTMPIEDYPTRPDMPPVVGLIEAGALAAQVEQVAKFAGKDKTLPMMTGVHVVSDGPRLILEATDRYRLAVRELDWANEVDKLDVLVPAKLLAEVTKFLGKDAGALVTVGHNGDGLLAFETDRVRVTMRLLDGANYPPIRSLIPEHTAHDLDVDAADLVGAVGRVAVALYRSEPLVLRLGADTLTLAGGGESTASEPFDGAAFLRANGDAIKAAIRDAEAKARKAHAKDPKETRDRLVTQAGEQARAMFEHKGDLLVGVNPAYFTDVLTTLGTKRVRIRIVDPLKPFPIVPLDSAGQPVPGVTNLLMPIRVSQDDKPSEAAPPAKPEPVKADAEPVDEPEPAPAAPPSVDEPPVQVGEVVYDKRVPHPFAVAVVDGRKPNACTKCKCGTTYSAKVHRAARAAAASVEAGRTKVPDGPVWMAVLQLASKVHGQMTTEATVAAADAAVKQFGKAVDVLVRADDNGKRMYVAAQTRQDAQLMQTVAAAMGIPAHVTQGVWPPQDAAADNEQEGTQVKQQEQSPVIVGEPKFDARKAAKEAHILFGSGRFDEALALVDEGIRIAPDQTFRDTAGHRYGWGPIREAIVVKQLEAEIAAEAEQAKLDALADITAEPVVDGQADVQDGPVNAEVDVTPEPEPEVDEDPVVARLRAALAGHPDEVIEAAVAAAASVRSKVTAPSKPLAAQPAPAGRVQAAPVASTEVERWRRFGMTPPVNLSGERVFVLPAGTRLRALRAAVVDGLRAAHRDGVIGAMPIVDADKSTRPFRLRVRFTEPGALTAATELVNQLVEAAMPDVLPASVDA